MKRRAINRNAASRRSQQTTRVPKVVLALNAGSSSLKFALFRDGSPPHRIFSGSIDRIGLVNSIFTLKRGDRSDADHVKVSAPNHVSAMNYLLARIDGMAEEGRFAAIGHRVVHGGPLYREPQVVDGTMLTELRRIRSFDPEHLPAEIALMEAFAEKFPGIPQVACFDTAFHRDMPRVAKLLPLPRRYDAKGLQRYGFHGLSYTYLLRELQRKAGIKFAKKRLILAHLGNGASMVEVRNGKSIDTTMAFTPAAGLVMSTRSGDLDPGLVTFLARNEQMTASQFDRMVNHESGLLGVSETSSDMRDLLAREKKDVRAAEAVALFCYQAKKFIGAYAAALGGLDALVFAGGIGEHAAPVRARICEGLEFLGVKLDRTRNNYNADIISGKNSPVEVRIIQTDEELIIATAVCRVVTAGARNKRSTK